MSDVEQNTRNLRFRDNNTLFNSSAAWLDAHRDEGLPVMASYLADQGPEAIGVAIVMGALDDVRAVPSLAATLGADDERLAYEAARALSRIGDPAAAEALSRGAASERQATIIAALRGIELRGDESLCDAVRPHLDAADPVGAYALRASKACQPG